MATYDSLGLHFFHRIKLSQNCDTLYRSDSGNIVHKIEKNNISPSLHTSAFTLDQKQKKG